MSIPQRLVDDLLVKCGRRCCVCRRYAPLHLQVHHIVERAQGGNDDPDNLIAVCLTCHSDIHTKTALTRRFTVVELKGHRDALIALVSEGKLPNNTSGYSDYTQLIDTVVTRVSGHETAPRADGSKSLSAGAVKMLLDALSEGTLADMSETMAYGTAVDEIREMSRNKRYLVELCQRGLLRHVSGILYCVTDEGFLLGDELLAASQPQTPESK